MLLGDARGVIWDTDSASIAWAAKRPTSNRNNTPKHQDRSVAHGLVFRRVVSVGAPYGRGIDALPIKQYGVLYVIPLCLCDSVLG